jgi:putative Holliday junction resolvase
VRLGKRLAIDVGKARVGVAICDHEGILSSPIDALPRLESDDDTVEALMGIINEQCVIEVYVGEPLGLSGNDTESTRDSRVIADKLGKVSPVPVRMIDERFTTKVAASKLRAAGVNSRGSKSLIDSASAVEILDGALGFEKSSGVAPGKCVGDSVGA